MSSLYVIIYGLSTLHWKFCFTFLVDSLLSLLRKLFSKMKINILKGEKSLFLKKKMKRGIINLLSIKELNKEYQRNVVEVHGDCEIHWLYKNQ